MTPTPTSTLRKQAVDIVEDCYTSQVTPTSSRLVDAITSALLSLREQTWKEALKLFPEQDQEAIDEAVEKQLFVAATSMNEINRSRSRLIERAREHGVKLD